MSFEIKELPARAAALARHPRTRKTVVWTVSLVLGFGILFGLAAPPLIRGQLASTLSEKLHREVTIEQIRINPYAMTVAVRGFLMKERREQTAAVAFDELFVNLELQSLFRLAPIIKELRLEKPYIRLARDEERKYNFQDIIDEFTSAPSDPDGSKTRFALHNIEIIDGKIDFEDRPENTKHTISQLKIGVPFISSLEPHVDITVKPEFYALVNGAPFQLAGDTKPFKDSLDSTIGIEIEKLEITKYLEYSPVTLNFKVPSGQLEAKLNVSFRAAKDSPAEFSIDGDIRLADLEMQQTNGAPLLKVPALDVNVDALEIFAARVRLGSIKSRNIELHVSRESDGSLNLARLAEPGTRPAAPAPKEDEAGFIYAIDEIVLESSTLHFLDESTPRPYKTRLDRINLNVSALTNEPGKQAGVELSFESQAKEKFTHSGTLQLTPLLAAGKLAVEGFKPAALHPYYEHVLAAEIKDGALDLALQYSFANQEGETALHFTDLNAALSKFRLELPGQPQPLWRIAALTIKNADVDVAGKTIVIGAVEGKDGAGYIHRARDGTLNLARIVKAQAHGAAPAELAAKNVKKEGDWRVDLKRIALDRLRVDLDDRTNSNAAKINLSGISVRADGLSTAKNQPGRIAIRTRINNKGALSLTGTAITDPLNGKLAVDARDIDLTAFQPYLTDHVTFLLTGGSLAAGGELAFAAGNTGSPAKVSYRGSARLTDFRAIEQSDAHDLLKWKSLALEQVQFGSTPFHLRIGEVTLADFYSRLVLGADGKLNLQKLTATTRSETAEAGALEPATEVAAPAEPSGASENAVSIGKVNLRSGNIHFSDFFIKPNYSANLTSVDGAISELTPESPGELDLKARLDEAAPVEIKGKINPLGKDLFLDIVAHAKEIDLNPFTPYSAKYVGYGIERGQLSFKVKYKLENRKLSAENNIVLNQLTFGEKIESPTAIKAPVLLAVALLKDRNGVIDVDLPISGSLDDPQFSVGGIVLRMIVNIVTRAVTAPFSLLASAFGTGVSGDELSYIEFAPGRATLAQNERQKIATLAKALSNRPALNLEIVGRADPLTDLDGLKRVGIERKVKAQKLKELARQGEAQPSLDDVQVAESEYPRYLKAAYGEETFPKPRNIIGFAKDLPVPEMEKLMMQHAKAGDDDLRQLAHQRAVGVRNALLAAGQVGAERLFIGSGKPLTSEERAKLKGRPNRVDFSMK